ncbi:MAG TPA: HD domain-containing protein [Mobilitalea sp.]|nr:HD domain-containing protein [Mobilitalea sp.]
MDRILKIKKYVDHIIEAIASPEIRKYAYIHTYGVTQSCSIIAGRRGLDPELAYISGLLHDNYVYFTGSYMCHGQSGAEMARPAIRDMKLFTDHEKMLILSAVFYHSMKEQIHDEYDEVLKDADILQSFFYDPAHQVPYKAVPRINKILDELHITGIPIQIEQPVGNHTTVGFNKAIFADIAEELAAKNIVGDKNNKDFMEIIKYYPEVVAFDELKNAWCAAFVYHCAIKAGLELPIKNLPSNIDLQVRVHGMNGAKPTISVIMKKMDFPPREAIS